MITKKRITIWAVVMVLMIFLANLAGTLMNKLLYADTLLPAMTGYSRKMVFPLESDGTEQGDKKVKALIMVRSVLSDFVISNDDAPFFTNLFFAKVHCDQSIVFKGPEGLTSFSSGIFAPVIEDTENKIYMLGIIGAVDIRKFSELDCAKQLYEVLENNKTAKVRLDSYAISNYMVEPAKITVLDDNGSELLSVECPYTGEVQKADNIIILNRYKDDNDSESLYLKLKIAYLGERSADKKSKALAETLDFGKGDYYDEKTQYGFGKMTAMFTEVKEGRGAAVVLEYSFLRGVLLDSALFCLIATIIMLIVCRNRDRRNSY